NPAERSRVPQAAHRPGAGRGDAAVAADTAGSVLRGLDPDQRAAATAAAPLLIIAGPGPGKTRTLPHPIPHQVTEPGRPARQFLAITFTRRAAQEMRDRLAGLGAGRGLRAGPGAGRDGPTGTGAGRDGPTGTGAGRPGMSTAEVTVTTFHGLSLRIL